jgi:hypothetical protein
MFTAKNILDLGVYYISGGKETRTYGVAVKTGQMLYECSMEGCNNSTENVTPDDIIVIQRHTQTVRAIEARTGTERLVFLLFCHGRNGVALLNRLKLAMIKLVRPHIKIFFGQSVFSWVFPSGL